MKAGHRVSGFEGMRFPVTIAFAGAWRVHMTITDGSGAALGYSPPKFGKDNCMRIYTDESMAEPIYALRADPLTRRRFDLIDAAGGEFGRLELNGGWSMGYTICVGGEPRFDVGEHSPALHFVDGLFGMVPVVNKLTGMVLKPCHVVRRRGGGEKVATIVKQRTTLDVSYVVEQDGALDARESECILVGAAYVALNARSSPSAQY